MVVTALSQAYVRKCLVRCGNYRVEMAQTAALEGDPDEISGALLLSLGLQESGLQNINNEAGTDRGCFQISDRYHIAWLYAQPGCPAGSWHVEAGKTAWDPGYCPRFTPALVYALDFLQAKRIRALTVHDVEPALALPFALACYNAGEGSRGSDSYPPSGALGGLEAGDIDAYTTRRNYSATVIANRTAVNQVLHQDLPHWIVR